MPQPKTIVLSPPYLPTWEGVPKKDYNFLQRKQNRSTSCTIKLCGEENKSTPSKPTAFSSWFCWVIKAATLTTGKDDGHSGFGAPCHRCVVFVDSRDEKVQRLREKIYDIFIIIRIYHIHLKTPPPKKKTVTLKYETKTQQSWTWITCSHCFFFKSQMPHGHSSKLPESKSPAKKMPSKHGDYNALTWLEHASRLTSHMPLVTASTASNFKINRNFLCKLLQATSPRFPCATPAWLDSKVTRAKSSNSVDGLVRPPGGPAGRFTSQYQPPLIKDDSEFICVYLSYLQFIYI